MALLLARQRRRRRVIMRPMRDRMNPLDYMQEDELIKKYRLDRNGIFDLCQVLHYDLNHPTHRHNSLPTSLRIFSLHGFNTSSTQTQHLRYLTNETSTNEGFTNRYCYRAFVFVMSSLFIRYCFRKAFVKYN